MSPGGRGRAGRRSGASVVVSWRLDNATDGDSAALSSGNFALNLVGTGSTAVSAGEMVETEVAGTGMGEQCHT